MSDPVASTPSTSEPMIPLSAVLPLLGWAALQLTGLAEEQAGDAQGPAPAFLAAYDLAASVAGLPSSAELFVNNQTARLVEFTSQLRDPAHRPYRFFKTSD